MNLLTAITPIVATCPELTVMPLLFLLGVILPFLALWFYGGTTRGAQH